MQRSRSAPAGRLTGRAIHQLLEETAASVRAMKASWLKVATNLRRIREEDLWRHATPECASFDEYVYGVLKLNRGVARRMLQAMDYTLERRPRFLDEVEERGDEVEVPSYEVIHQLRRAEGLFAGREDEFRDLESKVFDEGVGRVVLQREIESRIPGGNASSGGPAPAVQLEEAPDLGRVIERLKDIERELLMLDVPKEARRLLFRLVELLEKEK